MTEEDHDTLIRIETKLDRALGDISNIDSRVGLLEKGYWKLMGAVMLAVVTVDLLFKWWSS